MQNESAGRAAQPIPGPVPVPAIDHSFEIAKLRDDVGRLTAESAEKDARINSLESSQARALESAARANNMLMDAKTNAAPAPFDFNSNPASFQPATFGSPHPSPFGQPASASKDDLSAKVEAILQVLRQGNPMGPQQTALIENVIASLLRNNHDLTNYIATLTNKLTDAQIETSKRAQAAPPPAQPQPAPVNIYVGGKLVMDDYATLRTFPNIGSNAAFLSNWAMMNYIV